MDRGKPLKRTGIKRGGKRLERKAGLSTVAKSLDRRRRASARRRKMMGDDTGLAPFIRRLPCRACAPQAWVAGRPWEWSSSTPSVPAHIATRGTGQGVRDDNGDPNVLPLCQPCHGTQHTIGWDRFEKRHGFYAGEAALIVADEFERRQAS